MSAQTEAAPAPAAPPAPLDTPSWLREHCPRAERWYRLWLADREALRLAREVADTLPDEKGEPNTRADRLLLEHADAERTASLGYLSELITAEVCATRDISARVVRPETVERLTARRARLAELINEAMKPTEPKR